MQFRVIAGKHIHYGKEYVKGDLIDSPHDLRKEFVNKFERVDGERINTTVDMTPEKERQPMSDSLVEAERTAQTQAKKSLKKTSAAPVAATPDGVEVTNRFPNAVEQECRVFKHDGLYFVYDTSDMSAPINAEGTNRAGVEAVVQSIVTKQ